jgi:MOSC domain-containing protein YiiM
MITLVSLQVGKVKTHHLSNGTEWTTAFYKDQSLTQAHIYPTHVDGDEQHHKKFHGGEHRAVLMYSADHYPLWQQEFNFDFPYGAFGENFSVAGLDEDSVCLGDIYQIGDTVKLQVSQPRRPCNQIGQRWNMPSLSPAVTKTLRTGWYLRVLQEGVVSVGMPITLLERSYPQWTIRQSHHVYDNQKKDRKAAFALSQCEALEPTWREKLAEQNVKAHD